jgi:hypothetical protein
MESINWLAVLVAAVSTFILGGLWYGPLFGRLWMRVTGITEAQANQANMAKVFGLSFVLEFIAAAVLAMFIGADATVALATFAGFAVGLFWVGAALGVLYLFEQRPFAHWAVNAGYHTVAFTVMGAILGAWP